MSKDITASRLPGALRQAVKEALEVGWTAKRGGSGWKLRSPGGTQWMHIAPATNIPDDQARSLRSKMAKAAIEEADPEFLLALDDPKDGGATVECRRCGVEFLTMAGFEGHKYGCLKAAEAALAAQQAVEVASAPEADESPSQGRAGHPEEGDVEVPKSPDSDRLNIKEEVVAESTNGQRGGYSWNVVKPGLARALYTAMMSRSRHKGEATSTYANVLAAMVEEAGLDFATPPVLSEAQEKLDTIVKILGIDMELLATADSAQRENEHLRQSLAALKDLIKGL